MPAYWTELVIITCASSITCVIKLVGSIFTLKSRKIIHRTTNKHQNSHSNGIHNCSKCNPRCDESSVRFNSQNKDATQYYSYSHYQYTANS
uniref:Putative secreted protein n=1 Tax=Panstrongylus lignarius TaxID=156445 RepID=A0A224Y2B4_9HEMI